MIEDVIKGTKGYMLPPECHLLYKIASQISSNLWIVEIGSHQGRSTCCLGLGSLSGYKAKVHAVDLWELYIDYERGTERGKKIFTSPQVFNTFLKNLKKYGVEHIVDYTKEESTAVAKQWQEPIGFLFIDGKHSYEGVKDDFEYWSPFVVDDGYIVFHDYSKNFPGVIQLVDEIVEAGLIHKKKVVESLYIATKNKVI